MQETFRKFSNTTATAMGSSWTFIISCIAVVVWAVSGPLFHFSDTWQLIANTSTTIITFLAVFLIQNTQNRDAIALHTKLDAIIKSLDDVADSYIDLENRPDVEVKEAKERITVNIRDESNVQTDS